MGIKIIKTGNNVVVYVLQRTIVLKNIADDLWDKICKIDDEKELLELITGKKFEEEKIPLEIKSEVSKSKHLKIDGQNILLPNISNVPLSKDLVDKILDAENKRDYKTIKALSNFWLLLSQNPNIESRENLLLFLEKHQFEILENGLFVAYRNVYFKNPFNITDDEMDYILKRYYEVIHNHRVSPKQYAVYRKHGNLNVIKTSELTDNINVISNLYDIVNNNASDIYTDGYTKTFNIVLRNAVKMNRSECDEDSNQTCSRGLHLAHKNWGDLKYFGDRTIRCLVNPKNVVAVPVNSEHDYGKMRVCEYFPLNEVTKDDDGNVIDTPIPIEEINEYLYISYEDKIIDDFTKPTFGENYGRYDFIVNNKLPKHLSKKLMRRVIDLRKSPFYKISEEVRNKMLYYQHKQGNISDIKVFIDNPLATKKEGGFNWNRTKEGGRYFVENIKNVI